VVIKLIVCVVKSLSNYWINFLLSPWTDFSSHQYFASPIRFSKVFIACQWQACLKQNYSSSFMVQDSKPEFLDKICDIFCLRRQNGFEIDFPVLNKQKFNQISNLFQNVLAIERWLRSHAVLRLVTIDRFAYHHKSWISWSSRPLLDFHWIDSLIFNRWFYIDFFLLLS
jgi:hypothetical protein